MRIVFAGTPAFSVPCMKALQCCDGMEVVGVVSQPDRRSGRGMKLTPSPVKQAALDMGIDTITPESLRDNPGSLTWLESKRADMLVVVAFGMILPKAWLDAPDVAPVNVHASLLPRWRGAAPIERSLLAGDTKTGVCIMHMEEGLDTGGIYAARSVPIENTTTGTQLWASLSHLGVGLLLETLPGIASGALQPVPQNEARAMYAFKVENSERNIDWTLSADVVDRQVRCFSPKPGARTRLDRKWVRIVRGTPLSDRTTAQPGTLMSSGGLDVTCGDGSLYRVTEVQAEGKNVMSAEAFLRGNPLMPGQSFEAKPD